MLTPQTEIEQRAKSGSHLLKVFRENQQTQLSSFTRIDWQREIIKSNFEYLDG